MPGEISGNVTRRSAVHGAAPRLIAACSSAMLKPRSDAVTTTTTSGMREQRMGENQAPEAADQMQRREQEIDRDRGDDRRHDERRQQRPVYRLLPRKVGTHESECCRGAERCRQDACDTCHLYAEHRRVDPAASIEISVVPAQRKVLRRELQVVGRAERDRNHDEHRKHQKEQHRAGDDPHDQQGARCDAIDADPTSRTPPDARVRPTALSASIARAIVTIVATSSTMPIAAAKPQFSATPT